MIFYKAIDFIIPIFATVLSGLIVTFISAISARLYSKKLLPRRKNPASIKPEQMSDKNPPSFDGFVPQKESLDELYEKRNTDNAFKKFSFFLAVIMSVFGTLILFVGMILTFVFSTENAWITTTSGAIVELVAGVYFWLVNRTMKEVRENSKQVKQAENLLTAIELAEKINDLNIRDETYRTMINTLISSDDKEN